MTFNRTGTAGKARPKPLSKQPRPQVRARGTGVDGVKLHNWLYASLCLCRGFPVENGRNRRVYLV